MSEYYAYITHGNGLAVRKRAGLHEFQQQFCMIKHYLGLFIAEDMDHAREIAAGLKDEHDREVVRTAIEDAVGAKR